MSANNVKFLWVKNTSAMAAVIEELAQMQPADRPSEPAKFESLLQKHGVEYEWPNGPATTIHYNDMADDILSVSVPSLNAIKEGANIAKYLSNGPYPLDPGYDLAYTGGRKPGFANPDEWDEIYKTRLGDYTIGKCM